jgi:hypothetical protein
MTGDYVINNTLMEAILISRALCHSGCEPGQDEKAAPPRSAPAGRALFVYAYFTSRLQGLSTDFLNYAGKERRKADEKISDNQVTKLK